MILSRNDFEWHENPLIVSLLNEHSLLRQELYKRLRRIQEVKNTPLGRLGSHSNTAYRYWVRHLQSRGIVEEDGKMLSLTQLGRWVANSKLGTIFQRERFTSLICSRCSTSLIKVVLKPLVDTREINRARVLFMDFQCPQCGDLQQRCNLSGIAKEEEFLGFYVAASGELAANSRKSI